MAIPMFSQFRMVGVGNWTNPSANTYLATVTFYSDLSGNDYIASFIENGYRVFDERENIYEVIGVSGAIFNQATLTIEIITDDNSNVPTTTAPQGQIMVYDSEGRRSVPQVPFNSSGATARLQAAVDTWNARLLGDGGSPVPDSLSISGPVLRLPSIGDTLPTTTPIDWITWHYFTEPTIALSLSPSNSLVVEIGTTTNLGFTSTTTNPGNSTLSNGEVFIVSPDTTLDSYGATTSSSGNFSFTPLQTPSGLFTAQTYQVKSTQDWVFGAESGTSQSATRTIRGVYPVFYGMIADTATAFGDIYNMTKLIQTEGNKTVSYTGTGLIFYCMPETWIDTNLSSIIDPNGFNVTASFTRVTYPTVSSTGLDNNYTNVGCTCYFLNTGTTTTNNSNYTFNR